MDGAPHASIIVAGCPLAKVDPASVQKARVIIAAIEDRVDPQGYIVNAV